MSAPTNAPVLAWVVPFEPFGWTMIRANGTRDGYEAVSREVAESYRSVYDAEHPEHAPHTVQQLARVVRVVDTETVMHVPCSRALVEQFSAESAPVTVRIDTEADGIAQLVFTRYTPPVVAVDDLAHSVYSTLCETRFHTLAHGVSGVQEADILAALTTALTPPEPTGTEG